MPATVRIFRSIRTFLLLLLPACIAISCSVQKRHYRKGFYVDRPTNAKNIQKPKEMFVRDGVRSAGGAAAALAEDPAPEPLASAERTVNVFLFNKPAGKPLYDSCDVIFLRNGDEIRAKVIDISDQEVRYRKCSMPDGPMFVSLNRDIFMIKFTNGSKQLFERPAPPAAGNARGSMTAGPRDHPSLIPLCAITAVSLFFPPVGIASFFLGKRMLRDIKARPGTFKNRSLVQVCMIVGIVMSLLVLAYLLLFFALIFLF